MSDLLVLSLGISVLVAGLAVLVLFPEIAFALFLYSYVLEGGDVLPEYFDLTLVTLVIAVLGFLLALSKSRRLVSFQLSPPDVFVAIVAGIVILAALWSPVQSAGLLKAARFAVLSVAPYFIARIFLRDSRHSHRFLFALLVLATIIALLLLTSLLSVQTVDFRLQLLEANQIPVGVLLSVGFVIAVIAVLEGLYKGLVPMALLIGIAFVCLVGIVSLGVRGPLVAALVGGGVYSGMKLWLSRDNLKPLARSVGAILLALGAVIAAIRLVLVRLPMFEHYYTMTAVLEGLSTRERLLSYEAAIKLFLDRPILGVGTAGFSHLTAWTYPHNIFLETAVETGVLGLFFLVVFLVAVALIGARALKEQKALPKTEGVLVLMVLTIAAALLAERQVSFGLDSNKDLFAFLGLAVNYRWITIRRDASLPTP